MKWQTAISKISDTGERIRGYDLHTLIAKKTFAEAIFLVLRGELPTEKEVKMFNAILVACIDHGIGVASALAARLTASAGNSLHTALASGILAFGKLHGGAAEDAANFFSEHLHTPDIRALVNAFREKKVRISGYGHKILKQDSRAQALCARAKELEIYGRYCEFAHAVEIALNELSSKKLPLNIDGALAAILLDMGFDSIQARAVFLIGRTPGLVAHIHEEIKSGPGLRRLAEEEIEYTGDSNRKL